MRRASSVNVGKLEERHLDVRQVDFDGKVKALYLSDPAGRATGHSRDMGPTGERALDLVLYQVKSISLAKQIGSAGAPERSRRGTTGCDRNDHFHMGSSPEQSITFCEVKHRVKESVTCRTHRKGKQRKKGASTHWASPDARGGTRAQGREEGGGGRHREPKGRRREPQEGVRDAAGNHRRG